MPCLLVAKFVGKCCRNCRCRTRSVISAYQLVVYKLYVILSVNVGSLVPLCLQEGLSVELLFFPQILNVTSHHIGTKIFWGGSRLLFVVLCSFQNPAFRFQCLYTQMYLKGSAFVTEVMKSSSFASFACFTFRKVCAQNTVLGISPLWHDRYQVEGTTKHRF